MREKDTKNKMTGEDRLLWEKVTGGVQAYRGKKQLAAPKVPAKKVPLRDKEAQDFTPSPVKAAHRNSGALMPAGFDRATETKMKKGKLPIEGRIDLHGMTQEQAHRALARFVSGAIRDGKRNLLVITGKGSVSEGGVLRRMLPLWCETGNLAGRVLALTQAQPKDGGAGAFYLRLRKDRN